MSVRVYSQRAFDELVLASMRVPLADVFAHSWVSLVREIEAALGAPVDYRHLTCYVRHSTLPSEFSRPYLLLVVEYQT